MTATQNQITLDLEPTSSIIDAMEAGTQMFLRMNQIRGANGERRSVPVSVVITFAPADLTDRHRKMLRLAEATGYLQGAPFRSPEEVTQFFRQENIETMWGPDHMRASMEQCAGQPYVDMAEAVILSRRHCDF